MRVAVVGLGVQGRKRRAIAGDQVVAVVDPVAAGVDFQRIEDVPVESYDAACVCVPDQEKFADPSPPARQWKTRARGKTAARFAGRNPRADRTLPSQRRDLLHGVQSSFRTAYRRDQVDSRGRHSRPDLSRKIFLRQRHRARRPQFTLARQRSRRFLRSGLAHARYGAFSFWSAQRAG